MSKDSLVTLVLMAILLSVGSVCVVTLHTWWVTALFCAAIISWSLRLLAQMYRDRHP